MLRPRTRPTFDAALRDRNARAARARVLAAEALARPPQGREDEAIDALIEATSDHHPDVRIAAVGALAELGGERICEALCLVLDDGNAVVRQNAAIALGTLGESAALPALRQALESGPPDLRFQAATSMVEIDAEAALEPVLGALQREEDPEVMAALALCLGTIGDARGREPLGNLLEHPAEGPRFDAAYALAQLGDERAIPVLRAFLGHKDRGWDAASALRFLGRVAESTLAEALRPDVPKRTRLHAAGCLLALAPESASAEAARAQLLAGLGERHILLRAIAIDELGRVGGQWAVGHLADLRRRRRGRMHVEDIDSALEQIAARTDESAEASPP